MKINRITFDKIKAQYEILKMSAAYIQAEQMIVKDPNLTGWQIYESKEMSPEEFVMDIFGNVKNVDATLTKMEADRDELEKLGTKLLNEEKYEFMQEAKELWEQINKQIKRYKDKL